jgi:hypothetical protein
VVAPIDDLPLIAAGDAGEAWVHQLLARLMLRHQDGPDTFLVHVPGTVGRAALDALLGVLDGSGPLAAVLAADAAGALAADELAAAPRPGQDLAPVAQSLAATLDQLATYESFYVDGPDAPARYRSLLSDALGLATGVGDRASAIEDVGRQLDAALSVVSLPQNQSVTLAARSVAIPLTLTNASGSARQVLLRFRSDKFIVAEHGRVITIEPGTSSIDLQVEARSLGVSPLDVIVLTPDGRRQLATTRFQVRSTAIPGLGLLISAVGLVLLAAWWYVSIRRRRSSGSSRGDPLTSDGPAGEPRLDRDSTLASGSV